MTTAFIILAVGLVAILLEFFVPGGILGSVGALLVIASIVIFGLQSHSLLLTLLYTSVTAALLAILIKIALWRIRSGKTGVYSDSDQEGFIASTWNRQLVGHVAVVSSDLRPGGHIIIEGKQYSAISQSGYIVKGREVIVVGGEGDSLMVKHHEGVAQ